MKILIIGDAENFEEFKLKFGDDHQYTVSESLEEVIDSLTSQEVIFDFTIETAPENVLSYTEVKIPVFLNTVKFTLAEIMYLHGPSENLFGFNGIKTFVNRKHLEVTAITSIEKAEEVLNELKTNYLKVDDRVGMVTPRVIFMIINEAFYTVQEGTASREDIDLGMKLGTNYPFGPFEWLSLIGIEDVYETLEALYEDTKEERYKICPLLKKEYMAVTLQ